MIGNDLIFGFGLTLALITGFFGIYVAKKRGRSNTEGFLLGFFFSLLGVLIEVMLPKSEHSTYSILTKKVYKDLILLFFILLAIGFLGILMS